MRRITSNPWLVCLSAAGFFFYQYIQITSFNVLKPDLMLAFNTTSASLSLLASLYFYGTILFLIPAGIMLDNLSTRTIILLAMSISLVGLLIFTTSTSMIAAGCGRFLVGLSGGPFCFLSMMRLASRWFPENRLAFVTGVLVSFGMVGGIIAQTPFIYLVQSMGWQNAMYVNLGLGLVLTTLVYLFVYDYPVGKEAEYNQQIAFNREMGFVNGLKIVVTKAQNWYCGIFASLLNLPIFVFGALMGILYLTDIFGVSRIQASIICSGLFLGMIIGAPTFGYISDKLHLRKVPMLLGLIICLISVIILLKSSSLSVISLAILFYLIGFGSSSQVIAYPTVTESNPIALTGSALSLASTIIMAGGAIFQPLIGYMLEKNWDKAMYNGLPKYTPNDYDCAFWVVPASIVIAGIIVWFIRETYCRRTIS